MKAAPPASSDLVPNDVDWMQSAADPSERIEQGAITISGEAIDDDTTLIDDELSGLNETVIRTLPVIVNLNTRSSRQKRQTIEGSDIFTPLEVFRVKANGTYRFRHINTGFLNCPVEMSIDGHNLTVIASDGWYFEPVEVATLVSYAGERFDFVVNANQPVGNYWLRVRGLMDCDERFTKANQVAVLRYTGAEEEPGWPTEEWPTYEFERKGLQMNALNRGTGLVDSVSVAELTSLHETDVRLLQPQADFKFYVYYDFYDKDNPHFNHPDLYSNSGEYWR